MAKTAKVSQDGAAEVLAAGCEVSRLRDDLMPDQVSSAPVLDRP